MLSKAGSIVARCCQGDADLARMHALVRRHAAEHLHVIDLPHRLSSWALDDPQNTQLWFDAAGCLRAWAVLQPPFWTIDYALEAAEEGGLHGRVLDWAVGRAEAVRAHPVFGRPAWYVKVPAGQQERMADLTSRGFIDQMHAPHEPWSAVLMERSAQELPGESVLPAGWQLRIFDAEKEVPAYVGLHQAVFESKNMTAAWRARIVRQAAYRSELNLVIETPEATLAGFCVGWFDPGGHGRRPAGQIEPMGVLAQYRGRGLGKVLLTECMRRMVRLGAEKVYVETDNFRDAAYRLYESAGFRVRQVVHVFRRAV